MCTTATADTVSCFSNIHPAFFLKNRSPILSRTTKAGFQMMAHDYSTSNMAISFHPSQLCLQKGAPYETFLANETQNTPAVFLWKLLRSLSPSTLLSDLYTKESEYSRAELELQQLSCYHGGKTKELQTLSAMVVLVFLHLLLNAILLDKTTLVSNLSIYSKAGHVLILKTGNSIPTSLFCRKSCPSAQRDMHMVLLSHKSWNTGINLIALNGWMNNTFMYISTVE